MLINKLVMMIVAAYCTALASGQDPARFVYDQSVLRKHLEWCLSNRKMEPFPVMKMKRSGKQQYDGIDVHCTCRLPDDGCPMVCCDHCGEWFHQNRVAIQEIGGDWYCNNWSSTRAYIV